MQLETLLRRAGTHRTARGPRISSAPRRSNAARWYYPILMKGEWPVLLKILGKGEGEERYLSVAEVRTLFVERRLPERITARLPKRQA